MPRMVQDENDQIPLLASLLLGVIILSAAAAYGLSGPTTVSTRTNQRVPQAETTGVEATLPGSGLIGEPALATPKNPRP
jgi:hypothetical protein